MDRIAYDPAKVAAAKAEAARIAAERIAAAEAEGRAMFLRMLALGAK